MAGIQVLCFLRRMNVSQVDLIQQIESTVRQNPTASTPAIREYGRPYRRCPYRCSMGRQLPGQHARSIGSVPLRAVRLTPENGTCGWFIYGGEYSADADFYQPLHVAHLDDHCPSIRHYLGLPPGWCVLLAPDYEDVWFDSALMKNACDDARTVMLS